MARGLSRQGGIKFKIEKVNIISYAINEICGFATISNRIP
jgi:hypothetical protein